MVLSLNIPSVKISPAESVVLGRAGGRGEEPTSGCGDLVALNPATILTAYAGTLTH